MTFISTAIGVGNALIARVVLVGPTFPKVSAQTSLYPPKSRSISTRNEVTSITLSREDPASSNILAMLSTTAFV